MRGFAALLSFVALVIGAPAKQVVLTPGAIAFTPHDLWYFGNGAAIVRLGLPEDAIYVFNLHRPRIDLAVPGATVIGQLAIAPAGDRLAYVVGYPAHSGKTAESGVRVVEAGGSESAWFPDCSGPTWSHDGRLAMIELAGEEEGTRRPQAILVVDNDGGSRRLDFAPGAIAWGPGDTLYLQYKDRRVDALDVRSNESWHTPYVGCHVSPDGHYAFSIWGSEGFYLREDPGAQWLHACIFGRMGYTSLDNPVVTSASWIRSCAHLLCLSVSPGWPRRPGQEGIRTIVFDTRNLAIVNELQGQLVGWSADQKSALMLRSDTLAFVRLPEWPVEPSRHILGNVRMKVRGWSSKGIGMNYTDVSDSTVPVALGDWLPAIPSYFCKSFQIVGTHGPQLEVEFVAGEYVGYEADSSGHAKTSFGEAPATFATRSHDGGYYVTLSFAPAGK